MEDWFVTARAALGWRNDSDCVQMVPMPTPAVRPGLCVAYRRDGAAAVGVVTDADYGTGVMTIVEARLQRQRSRGSGVRWAVAPAARDSNQRDTRRLEQADGEDAESAWRLLDTDDGDRDAAVRVAWLDDMDWVAPGVRQLASSALCFRVVSDERHVRMSSSVTVSAGHLSCEASGR